MDGAVYHEFDCEKLYKELNNYKLYLQDCRNDTKPDEVDFLKTIDEQMAHTEYMISAMQEHYDCWDFDDEE